MRLLPELFEPLAVGPMQVANRLMMAGMSAGSKMDTDGDVAPSVDRQAAPPGVESPASSDLKSRQSNPTTEIP